MNENKQKSPKKYYQKVGFYFVLIYGLLTIGLIVQLLTVNVIPFKYIMIASVILVLLLLAMGYLQLGKRVNKINQILGKILIVILSLFLGVGNYYLYSTGSAFSKMTKTNTDVSVMSVIVLKNNAAQSISDLSNKKLGVTSLGDVEKQEKTIKDINAEATNIQTTSYKSYKDFGDALYNGGVDAILINEGSRGLFEDYHPKFDEETRVLKSYKYEVEVQDISKDVDVTKQPFNLYITGIDTYGTLSTVSRTDVNIIVSINPNTHQILMTGVPRDFYIPQVCQGNQKDKLTHTGIHGVNCTIESMQNYMGIELNYYARVNFSSLVNIVDALGGIDVNSKYDFTADAGGYHYNAGWNHLDGAQALGYVRERQAFGDGDRERSRNQMQVVEAMINKAISPSIITNYTNILSAVSDSFQTNMKQSDITSFIKQQLDTMNGWDIKQIQVNGKGQMMYSPANGFDSYMMIPNDEVVQNAVRLIKKLNNGELITDADVQAQIDLADQAG